MRDMRRFAKRGCKKLHDATNDELKHANTRVRRKPLWDGRLRDMSETLRARQRETLTGRTFARHAICDAPESLAGRGVCATRVLPYSLLGAARRGPRFDPVPLCPLRGGSVALLVLLAAAAGALIVTADLGRLAVHRLGGFAFVAIGAYLPLLCRHRPEQLLG